MISNFKVHPHIVHRASSLCTYLLLVMMSVCSCRSPYNPIVYQQLDSVLVSGYTEWYGMFYEPEGIDYPVASLDLYSKGLGLDDERKMQGKGTNLYLSDLFLPEGSSSLPEGEYKCDTAVTPYHCLPGMNYEGNYGGSYVLLVEESSYRVYLIREGAFTLRYKSDTMCLDGRFLLDNDRTYPCHLRALVPVIDRER